MPGLLPFPNDPTKLDPPAIKLIGAIEGANFTLQEYKTMGCSIGNVSAAVVPLDVGVCVNITSPDTNHTDSVHWIKLWVR